MVQNFRETTYEIMSLPQTYGIDINLNEWISWFVVVTMALKFRIHWLFWFILRFNNFIIMFSWLFKPSIVLQIIH